MAKWVHGLLRPHNILIESIECYVSFPSGDVGVQPEWVVGCSESGLMLTKRNLWFNAYSTCRKDWYAITNLYVKMRRLEPNGSVMEAIDH